MQQADIWWDVQGIVGVGVQEVRGGDRAKQGMRQGSPYKYMNALQLWQREFKYILKCVGNFHITL